MIDLTSDLQVLAATIYGESRGEPLLGQQAVASVIVNRANYAKAHRYPMFGDGTIITACRSPWQFSSWNENDPNRTKMMALDFEHPDQVASGCLAVAQSAVEGSLIDPTGGAMWYKTNVLPWPESWGKEVPPLTVIGTQSFYNLMTEQSLVSYGAKQ